MAVYTALAPNRFKDFSRWEASAAPEPDDQPRQFVIGATGQGASKRLRTMKIQERTSQRRKPSLGISSYRAMSLVASVFGTVHFGRAPRIGWAPSFIRRHLVAGQQLVSSQRSRRNLLAAGAFLAGAALSKLGTSRANAGQGGNGQGGNGQGGNGQGGNGGGGRGAASFLRGTCLLTPSGERKVEDVRIGDLVTTLSGDAKPITWKGRRVYRRSTAGSYPKSVLPVRVARGALGPEAPRRDLFVSQEHALCVDGVLIKAVDLINGSSITLQSAAEFSQIEYLHVKLARHDVIFAEGAPSETLRVYVGNVERFDNFVEYLRLFGDDAANEVRCAPIAFGNTRERLMSRLRSAVSPWADYRNEFDKARDRIEELADVAS
jgi:Hint domain